MCKYWGDSISPNPKKQNVKNWWYKGYIRVDCNITILTFISLKLFQNKSL